MCRGDRWFVLELLRLDFHLCDLSFDRHRSGSEKGVHPLHPRLLGTPAFLAPRLLGTPAFLAPPPSWHPRLLGTPAFLAPRPSWHPRTILGQCSWHPDICVLFFAGILGASWRMAPPPSWHPRLPWHPRLLGTPSNSVGTPAFLAPPPSCVHPGLLGTLAFLAPPPSWHPRLLGTPAFLAPPPSWHPRLSCAPPPSWIVA